MGCNKQFGLNFSSTIYHLFPKICATWKIVITRAHVSRPAPRLEELKQQGWGVLLFSFCFFSLTTGLQCTKPSLRRLAGLGLVSPLSCCSFYSKSLSLSTFLHLWSRRLDSHHTTHGNVSETPLLPSESRPMWGCIVKLFVSPSPDNTVNGSKWHHEVLLWTAPPSFGCFLHF